MGNPEPARDGLLLHRIELRAAVKQEAEKLMHELTSDGFDDPIFVSYLRDQLREEKERRLGETELPPHLRPRDAAAEKGKR